MPCSCRRERARWSWPAPWGAAPAPADTPAAEESPAQAAAAPIADAAVLLSLGEALQLPAAVAAALPPAFLVRSAADAERLARRHPGVAFLSREGVWVQAGTFHVEGETVTPGVLERESELAALEQAIPQLETEHARAAPQLDRTGPQ